MASFPAHVQLDVVCRGELDPSTSYVRDTKQIDQATVAAFSSRLTRQAGLKVEQRAPLAVVLGEAIEDLNRDLGGAVSAVRWWLTPYHSIEMSPVSPSPASAARSSPPAERSVLIRQRFDFSASHRLHNPALSEDANRACFGKCNNPAGHGHNYVVEPTVRVAVRSDGSTGFSHGDLEQVCSRTVIDRFDHKHLNVDTPEFSDQGGVLPTVENIARVFFDLLAPVVSARDSDARLVSVTVWETDRTSSTYPG